MGTDEQMEKVNKTDKKTLPPSFHMANIQNILTKTESGETGMFIKVLEKSELPKRTTKEEIHIFYLFLKPG